MKIDTWASQRKIGRDGEVKKGVFVVLARLAHISGRVPEPDFGYSFSWLLTPDDPVRALPLSPFAFFGFLIFYLLASVIAYCFCFVFVLFPFLIRFLGH